MAAIAIATVTASTSSALATRIGATAFCDDAETKFLEQFKRKPKLTAWVLSYCLQMEHLITVFSDILVRTILENAQGEQLDVIGRIVGQLRGGRTDEVYRVWIQARIAVLRSSGTADELLDIVRLLVPAGTALEWVEQPPAGATLKVVNPIEEVLGNQIAQLIVLGKSGGVRLLFHWKRPTATFKYSGTFGVPAAPSTAFGFGNGEYAAVSDGGERPFEP